MDPNLNTDHSQNPSLYSDRSRSPIPSLDFDRSQGPSLRSDRSQVAPSLKVARGMRRVSSVRLTGMATHQSKFSQFQRNSIAAAVGSKTRPSTRRRMASGI
jgi:hypothetical protein